MRVDLVDTRSAPDELLLAIHRIDETCRDGLAPGETWRSVADGLGFMRHPPADERRDYWLARLDGEPVGMAALFEHPEDRLGWVQLRVLPQYRRRGVGTALLGAMRARATKDALAGHHSSADGAAFARAVGARDDQRDVRSLLPLTAVTLPELRVPPGYELRTWVGRAPDDLVETFAACRNAINDAPAPPEQGSPLWTVERVRDLEDAVARRDREARVTVALADGEAAAFTELRVPAPPAATAVTDDTATVRAHRGRGLALAVKTESLLRLRADRPEVEVVTTLNAEANTAMRAVNARLGFVPVVTLTSCVLPLA